jgi:hypothetical protein
MHPFRVFKMSYFTSDTWIPIFQNHIVCLFSIVVAMIRANIAVWSLDPFFGPIYHS